MERIVVYRTSDGQTHETEEAARAHQERIELSADVAEWAIQYHDRPAEQTRAVNAVLAYFEHKRQLSLGLDDKEAA